MSEDITLKQYTMRYIKRCEDKRLDFDEVVYYNLVKLKYGNEGIILAKTLVQKYINNIA